MSDQRLTIRSSSALFVVGLVVLCSSGAALATPLPGTHTNQDRALWRAILHWPASCEHSWHVSHAPPAGIQTWSAPSGRRLVAVTCAMGVYQGSSMLYLVNTAHHASHARDLHIYGDPGNGTPTAAHTKRPLGQVSFSHSTATLSILDKFRSLGDCGIYSKFHLSGTHFVPTSTRAKPACDGNPPYNPNNWATLPLLSP